MTKFEEYMEVVSQRILQKQTDKANFLLQKSLRERSEQEVYNEIVKRRVAKSLAVLV